MTVFLSPAGVRAFIPLATGRDFAESVNDFAALTARRGPEIEAELVRRGVTTPLVVQAVVPPDRVRVRTEDGTSVLVPAAWLVFWRGPNLITQVLAYRLGTLPIWLWTSVVVGGALVARALWKRWR